MIIVSWIIILKIQSEDKAIKMYEEDIPEGT
jgi:hypothetical protein